MWGRNRADCQKERGDHACARETGSRNSPSGRLASGSRRAATGPSSKFGLRTAPIPLNLRGGMGSSCIFSEVVEGLVVVITRCLSWWWEDLPRSLDLVAVIHEIARQGDRARQRPAPIGAVVVDTRCWRGEARSAEQRAMDCTQERLCRPAQTRPPVAPSAEG